MAGLGETCTHIAAVLFYLEANTRIRGIKTCTQKECEWIIPSSLKTIEYLPTKDIDFSSARGKKRKLDEMMEIDDPAEFPCDLVTVSQGASPTDLEMKLLFEKLNLAGTKPAILSLIPPYSDEYVPKSSGDILPKPLKSLHQPSYLQLEYNELLNICETVSIQVTDETAEALEKETRLQSKSNLWYKHRAGRVTSSCMKAVCHTNVANPAQSLVKSICYPQELAFSSKQTDWGQKYEKVAREQYLKSQRPRHANILEVTDSGIVINPKWPFIGASPDGIVDCYCCGKGVLEIKYPYSHRHESIEAAASNDPNFCLKKDEDLLYLDHKHAYYYQVQTQMFVCNVDYCDFCVCTFPESVDEFSPYVERIFRDIEFWEDCVEKAKHFFTVCLLPEILGKWYTRPAVRSGTNQSNQSNSSDNEVGQYCYCCGPDEGTMIACDNTDCKIEWFHTNCLKLQSIPRGKWYCPDCRKLPCFLKGKGRAIKQ